MSTIFRHDIFWQGRWPELFDFGQKAQREDMRIEEERMDAMHNLEFAAAHPAMADFAGSMPQCIA